MKFVVCIIIICLTINKFFFHIFTETFDFIINYFIVQGIYSYHNITRNHKSFNYIRVCDIKT